MEGESNQQEQSVPATDQGLSKTEKELWKAMWSNSHAILARATETPISEIDIPLCRMISMTDVWQPFEIDIQKLRSEFTMGTSSVAQFFFVAKQNFSLEEAFVTDATKKGWLKLWQKEEKKFESFFNSN